VRSKRIEKYLCPRSSNSIKLTKVSQGRTPQRRFQGTVSQCHHFKYQVIYFLRWHFRVNAGIRKDVPATFF